MELQLREKSRLAMAAHRMLEREPRQMDNTPENSVLGPRSIERSYTIWPTPARLVAPDRRC